MAIKPASAVCAALHIINPSQWMKSGGTGAYLQLVELRMMAQRRGVGKVEASQRQAMEVKITRALHMQSHRTTLVHDRAGTLHGARKNNNKSRFRSLASSSIFFLLLLSSSPLCPLLCVHLTCWVFFFVVVFHIICVDEKDNPAQQQKLKNIKPNLVL